MEPYAIKVALSFPVDSTIPYETDLEKKVFKGSYFNKWFYFDSPQESNEKGLPYSNVYFDYDETTIIAVGVEDMSPSEFIMHIQDLYFVIDTKIEKQKRNGKNIIYSKRASR